MSNEKQAYQVWDLKHTRGDHEITEDDIPSVLLAFLPLDEFSRKRCIEWIVKAMQKAYDRGLADALTPTGDGSDGGRG